MPISLFPARAAIGRGFLPDGSPIDILMTIEFARALSDVLQRIGGTNGTSTADIETLVRTVTINDTFTAPVVAPANQDTGGIHNPDGSAQIAALRAEVADLRTELAMATVRDLSQQLEEIRVLLGMQDARPGIIKGIAAGSRAGNAALASALTALANSGLIVDNTTI